MTAWVPAAAGLAGCAAVGALAPYLVKRVPEPPPDPTPEDGVELTAAQQARAEEPPKEPYVDLARQSWLVPVAAGLSGAVGASLGLVLGWDGLLALLWPLTPLCVVLGIIDWRTKLLPSVLVLPATLAALVYGGVRWATTSDPDELIRGVVALLLVRSFFWILWFVRQAGLGFGDVRLGALLGCVLGYAGWPEVVVGVYASFLVFGLPWLFVAIVKRDRALLKRHFPFGPFMLLGAWIGLLAGTPVLKAIYG